MRVRRKGWLAFLAAFILLAAQGDARAAEPEAPRPAEEETLTAILDRDGSDGYTGDFVLIYNPVLDNGASLSTGSLDGLIDPIADPIPINDNPYLETTRGLYRGSDPYVTDELSKADTLYEFDGEDPWQVGFQKVFYVGETWPDEMLFVVTAVGERSRVWSPVNPAYGPLEAGDITWPEQLALEMDRAIPILEEYFAPIPDIRGDGKMNILCFDFNSPWTYGYTTPVDLYDEVSYVGRTWQGNMLPIVHINTAPMLQGMFSSLSELYTIVVHEMHHSIFLARDYPADVVSMSIEQTVFMEFLAVAAQDLVYPGSGLQQTLPRWYSRETTWADLAMDNAPFYLRGVSKWQNGKNPFAYHGNEVSHYGAGVLLAHFVENRCGPGAFANIMARWKYERTSASILRPVWEEMGYEDYVPFIEDFYLSILLHEESGPYQLHPFDGYNSSVLDGEENPFTHLVPVVTNTRISIGPGGFTVIRPVDGVYYPPAGAGDGLQYVGITLKQAG